MNAMYWVRRLPRYIGVFVLVSVGMRWILKGYSAFMDSRYPPIWQLGSAVTIFLIIVVLAWQWLTERQWLKTVLGYIGLVLVLVGVVYPFVRWGL